MSSFLSGTISDVVCGKLGYRPLFFTKYQNYSKSQNTYSSGWLTVLHVKTRARSTTLSGTVLIRLQLLWKAQWRSATTRFHNQYSFSVRLYNTVRRDLMRKEATCLSQKPYSTSSSKIYIAIIKWSKIKTDTSRKWRMLALKKGRRSPPNIAEGEKSLAQKGPGPLSIL
jgi:hypothetical protein